MGFSSVASWHSFWEGWVEWATAARLSILWFALHGTAFRLASQSTKGDAMGSASEYILW